MTTNSTWVVVSRRPWVRFSKLAAGPGGSYDDAVPQQYDDPLAPGVQGSAANRDEMADARLRYLRVFSVQGEPLGHMLSTQEAKAVRSALPRGSVKGGISPESWMELITCACRRAVRVAEQAGPPGWPGTTPFEEHSGGQAPEEWRFSADRA